MKNRKRGFTLIELLVVVLIIGILAAVALPQYEIAVKKTKVMRLIPLLRAIDSAEQVYFLENGTYTLSFDDLSIEMPAGGTLSTETNKSTLTYDDFKCLLRSDGSGRAAFFSVHCQGNGLPSLEKYYQRNHFICWGGGKMSGKICRNISGKTEAEYTLSSAVSPTGYKMD